MGEDEGQITRKEYSEDLYNRDTEEQVGLHV